MTVWIDMDDGEVADDRSLHAGITVGTIDNLQLAYEQSGYDYCGFLHEDENCFRGIVSGEENKYQLFDEDNFSSMPIPVRFAQDGSYHTYTVDLEALTVDATATATIQVAITASRASPTVDETDGFRDVDSKVTLQYTTNTYVWDSDTITLSGASTEGAPYDFPVAWVHICGKSNHHTHSIIWRGLRIRENVA